MGTWGPGIFSDDFAADLKIEFRDEIANGAPPNEALIRLQKRYETELADPDEAPVFWLALAATAWKIGRLEGTLKARALDIIARGEGLARWEEAGQLNERKRVLRKLSQQLESSQPSVVKLKKREILTNDWGVGEVLGLRLQSGNWTLLHVVGHHNDMGGRSPICELLDWSGSEVPPTQKEVDFAEVVHATEPDTSPHFHLFGLNKPKGIERVARLGMKRRQRTRFFARFMTPKSKIRRGGRLGLHLAHIDKQLRVCFGVE